MRLKSQETEIIRRSVAEVFGETTPVWVFGSRLDDDRRGGDIDLFQETALPPAERLRCRFRLLALLQERLGEQKIDLVLAAPDDPEDQDRLVVREAEAKGVRL